MIVCQRSRRCRLWGINWCIVGGRPLDGRLKIHGAKNAVLPMMAATLLVEGECVLRDCPHLIDVENMRSILQYIGCWLFLAGRLPASLTGRRQAGWEMPEGLSKKLRSSIFLLGPVLARFGRAKFSYPGGCEIGNRPIDLHLKGLRQLNVQVREEHGYIICDGENMRGAQVHLDYPSVGATENLMMAAVAARGGDRHPQCGARTRGGMPAGISRPYGRADQRGGHHQRDHPGRRGAAGRPNEGYS